MKPLRIETQRLILRDLNMGDKKAIAEKIGNIEVSKYLAVVPHPYEEKDAIEFLEKELQEQAKKERKKFVFGITLKEKDEVIGAVGISSIDHRQKQATLGYWLAQEHWGRGIMTEAAKEVVDFAFNKIALERINVQAVVENIGSNKVIEKLAFVHEGTKRKGMKSKATGKVHDAKQYGLLKEEWK